MRDWEVRSHRLETQWPTLLTIRVFEIDRSATAQSRILLKLHQAVRYVSESRCHCDKLYRIYCLLVEGDFQFQLFQLLRITGLWLILLSLATCHRHPNDKNSAHAISISS